MATASKSENIKEDKFRRQDGNGNQKGNHGGIQIWETRRQRQPISAIRNPFNPEPIQLSGEKKIFDESFKDHAISLDLSGPILTQTASYGILIGGVAKIGQCQIST